MLPISAVPGFAPVAPWSQLIRLLLPRRPSNGPRCRYFPAVVISLQCRTLRSFWPDQSSPCFTSLGSAMINDYGSQIDGSFVETHYLFFFFTINKQFPSTASHILGLTWVTISYLKSFIMMLLHFITADFISVRHRNTTH